MGRWLPRGSALGALCLAVGCSLVVPSGIDEIHCSNEGAIGPPACDPGYGCVGGVCRLCALGETCGDGIDNDCVGGVDNGCGGGSGVGGDAGMSGGGIPGDASAGSGGSPGGTGGESGSGGTLGGASGMGSGGASGGVGGGVGIGTPCPNGNECASGDFCADTGVFGLSAGLVCTRGCCKSDECGPGNVCYSTPGGNSLCFPNAVAGRPSGGKLVGEACAVHEDCRTGLCLGGACSDACCSNSDCPANIGACQAKDIGGKFAFVCAPAGTGKDYLFTCDNGNFWNPSPVPSECASRICIGINDVFTPYVCSKTCCRAADCSGGLTCRYGTLGAPTVKYCRLGTGGPGQMGAPCSAHADCQSGLCVQSAAGNFCSDACCRDTDCGSPGTFACRPGVLSGIAHLICVKL